MMPKMRRFYSIELVNIINNRKVHWLYNAKCVNCSFTGRCRKEAVGTWGAIPYMTERKVATLQKRAVDDIEDLATSLQKLRVTKDDDEDELADKLKSLAVSDTARHHRLRSKELRPFEEAYKTKKPQVYKYSFLVFSQRSIICKRVLHIVPWKADREYGKGDRPRYHSFNHC